MTEHDSKAGKFVLVFVRADGESWTEEPRPGALPQYEVRSDVPFERGSHAVSVDYVPREEGEMCHPHAMVYAEMGRHRYRAIRERAEWAVECAARELAEMPLI